MMKILNAEQIRSADAFTIEHEPIASIELMERASEKFVEAFYPDHETKNNIAVVCGNGNNGGDGLAISRILLTKGYDVQPFIVQLYESGSPDFMSNLKRLEGEYQVASIKDGKSLPDFNKYHAIIDAIFGSGLSRPVTGLYGDVIEAINKSEAEVVAVDIPSGLFTDKLHASGVVINASCTISFQLPKLSFFMPENFRYVGNWQVVNIGLAQEFIDQQKTGFTTIEKTDVAPLLPKRSKFAHKGSFGHGQIAGGSYGKMGAITLAAKAFMRTGAGLLTVTIPASGTNIMQTTVPEAMVLEQPGDKRITKINISSKSESIGIGPGLGQDDDTVAAFTDFLDGNKKHLILDADALNIISNNRELLSLLPSQTIITPHVKEFDRLVGPSENSWLRIEKAREFSQKWQLITVLKGAHTAVIDQAGKVRFNTTGNPGMATGGSGDVLLGIITSFRTQGLSAIDAAVAGVYIHGRAADIAIHDQGMSSLVASDIVNALGEVFLDFSR